MDTRPTSTRRIGGSRLRATFGARRLGVTWAVMWPEFAYKLPNKFDVTGREVVDKNTIVARRVLIGSYIRRRWIRRLPRKLSVDLVSEARRFVVREAANFDEAVVLAG